ncbi:MAG: penicillin acylase family protein [Thermodesulfobacteriota bacterium]|nr:penicillin acylase family protein [Thermodesulfobacteriota bacterium]
MRLLKKISMFILIILIILVVGIFSIPHFLNRIQDEGNLELAGLREPVKVLRDKKGMAYIYADNIHDAIMAQGFVTAQDRLFQMELTRLFASGRIAELAGEKGKNIDIRMRTIGFYRNAKKHEKILNPETRMFFQDYAKGVNAYIQTCPDTHHLEFRLAGIKPGPWTVADSITIMYYMGWDSAANIHAEIIAQMLVDKVGLEMAREIFPLNKNPDDLQAGKDRYRDDCTKQAGLNLQKDSKIMSYLDDGALCVGSNNWTTGRRLSASGKPIVANDPHLDSRVLPGPWYPNGIILPDLRVVGVMIPGIPGMVVGRNDRMAIGVTNAYGDAQDLYVEIVDPDNPDRYMEGEKSLPFKVIEESLKIKCKDAPGGFREEKIQIRLTKRGPVISGLLPGLKTDRVMTIRWSPFETMGPFLGIERILHARSVEDLRESLRHANFIMLNFVFADVDGNIGWQTSGSLPIRSQGDGLIPYVVKNGHDNWTGWIPYKEMPQASNPEKGWIGTCNHRTVTRDYPYYYSSHISSSYRYERLKELLNAPGVKSPDDHWQFQRDTMNLMAKRVAPLMARALMTHEDTKEMGTILSQWDFHDDIEKVAPTIFQNILIKFAYMVFQDELGEYITKAMLDKWTFWEERLEQMVMKNENSHWFDNVDTDGVTETRDLIFYQAAVEAVRELSSRFGDNPAKWKWGEAHKTEFVSPIRRSGFGKGFLGGGAHPSPGSVQTLYRGMYDFNDPFYVTVSDSLRMVVDLSDDDKVLAVLPGGVTGRVFNPHTTDQIEDFFSGKKVYWWFSDRAIRENAKATLILNP